MDTETILTAIRRKSDQLPASNNPELEQFAAHARIIQLWGMLELIKLLSESSVQVPAILDGGIRSEIDRLRSQAGGAQ